jgi:uncharacterized LabA/DUF88 family protein
MPARSDRAIIYIDGNNWYHALRDAHVPELMGLDYAAISTKLLGPRQWVGTRYYIGALRQSWDPVDYANQRRFLSQIQNDDARISVHLGRLEEREEMNELAKLLLNYLAERHSELPREVCSDLEDLAKQHRCVSTLKEKAVDIMLTVDMYRTALEDEYDAAYLLSADGDYTPLIRAVRVLGKKVYVACPNYGSALASVANVFIKIPPDWFDDCHR